MADSFEVDYANLKAEVGRLGDRIGGTVSYLELVQLRGEWQGGVAELREAVADLRARTASVQGELAAESDERRTAGARHAAALTALTERVETLHRHLRSRAGEAAARLDRADGDLLALAARAERGAEVRARRLPGEERDRLVVLRDRWPEWQRRRRDERATALRLSRAITDRPATDGTGGDGTGSDGTGSGRDGDAAGFRRARAALDRLDEIRDDVRTAADDAREQLDADDLVGESDAEALAAGDGAQQEFDERIRRTLSDAVAAGALLPVWFERALGAGPDRDPERWITTGTALIGYRIMFGVVDPVVALGRGPEEDWPAHRTALHTRLRHLLGIRPVVYASAGATGSSTSRE